MTTFKSAHKKSRAFFFEESETLNPTRKEQSFFLKILCVPKKRCSFFLREEREERKYIHLLQRKDKKQKKKKSCSISRTRKFTPSPEYYKKRWHSLYKSTPPRRQKRRPPPRRRPPRSRRCARVSFARVVFRPDSDFFFSSLSPKMVLSSSKGGEKTRPKNEPKKRNIRIVASLRIRPQKPPFRRRQTRASNAEMYREYIGARFDAAASVARRSRGGPFFRRLCVRKTKVERDLQSFFHRRSIYRTKTNVFGRWEKNDEGGEILFLVRF